MTDGGKLGFDAPAILEPLEWADGDPENRQKGFGRPNIEQNWQENSSVTQANLCPSTRFREKTREITFMRGDTQ